MNVPFLDLRWQHDQIKDALMPRLQNVIDMTAFTLGKDVTLFEEHFAEYLGVKYVIGVDNGTDALTLAYIAAGLQPGDEIITVPTTYIATVSAALHLGIRPVFVDIDENTRNFDMSKLKEALSPKTKAIVPVHLYGTMPDMDALATFASEHSLLLIEDTAQAHGARYKGKRAGSFGTVSAFSFYPGKNLGAYGQGGAVATSDEAIRDRVRKLRNQGEAIKYNHELLGYNSRLDTLQAVVLDEKLKKLDEWNAMRRAVAERYSQLLSSRSLRLSRIHEAVEAVHHLYVIEVLNGDRDGLIAHLTQKGIGAGIHYPVPLHLTPALRMLGYEHGAFPVAEAYCDRIASLPIFPGMSETQIQTVANEVLSYVER